MTTKHFKAAADIVRDLIEMGANEQEATLVANSFIELFQKFNNKFNKTLFLDACGPGVNRGN